MAGDAGNALNLKNTFGGHALLAPPGDCGLVNARRDGNGGQRLALLTE